MFLQFLKVVSVIAHELKRSLRRGNGSEVDTLIYQNKMGIVRIHITHLLGDKLLIVTTCIDAPAKAKENLIL